MPYLLSIAGFSLVRKYVKNWYSVIATYAKLIPSANVQFKNGKVLRVSRRNYGDFREELFRQYLADSGFVYSLKNKRWSIRTPTGVEMILLHDYSNIIDEIYLRKAYGEIKLDNRVVIDIGAALGDSSLYFASLGAAKVFGFEVDTSRFKLAEENIGLNNMNNTISIFNEAANSRSVINLVQKYALKHIFLKMDCEGCEYEIIENLPSNVLADIDDIVMEYHHKPDPLEQKLKLAGFKVKREKKVLVPEGRIYASRSGG